MNTQFLESLENLLKQRFDERPAGSYTTKLFESGPQKILQKVGEEAIEYILDAQIAASNALHGDGKISDSESQNADKQRAIYEGADLLYHFLVSLVAQGWSLGDIIAELERRHQTGK
ncbi:phosphoribosyl-ATP diphosphatase [Turneriella parva]|uniref:Phosphoribosyl-ATP pyrophosphatase n=1 Tax=Turneriella parva (strain ATCC BAA-1111 / DSM 21527 / NCTC 11395 / H) TaxID=869212 RepID=I4B9E9_TURPD|nr:phosphoribosyl-ATP diphosphatase [Turneriella parva]AFM13906.1 phosphoribosyl-ATP pyrophosphatase [Turneriella parva DSM 21527]